MSVAIIGTGISGITLALRLQQFGVSTTVLAERSPAQIRAGRVENLVARFPATQDRERELGVAHWDHVEGSTLWGIDVDVVGTPVRFQGRLEQPGRAVDFRVYLSRLTDDYIRRGGRLLIAPLPVTPSDLAAQTQAHDAVVVAAGRSAPLTQALFRVRRDRSPYSVPQRRLIGGLHHGVHQTDPPTLSFNIVPGGGEIFQGPFLTDRGAVAGILVEAVPGGPLEPVTHLDPAGDPQGYVSALLRAIEEFAPSLAARIDPARLAPLGPLDLVRGAVTPTVRRGWATLPDGRVALAIGDAWIVNDPITGQGANIGSHCAWHIATALAAGDRVDETFARRLEDDLWSFAGPVTAWTNGFLQPPPLHILDLLAAATAHQPVADAFANGFADPARLAARLATPEATAEFVADTLQLQEV